MKLKFASNKNFFLKILFQTQMKMIRNKQLYITRLQEMCLIPKIGE